MCDLDGHRYFCIDVYNMYAYVCFMAYLEYIHINLCIWKSGGRIEKAVT